MQAGTLPLTRRPHTRGCAARSSSICADAGLKAARGRRAAAKRNQQRPRGPRLGRAECARLATARIVNHRRIAAPPIA